MSPRDQRGGLLLCLRHRVAPQRLLREDDALVEPCQDGFDGPVRVGIELTCGGLALWREIQETGEVVHRWGVSLPQRIPPEGEQPEEQDTGHMTGVAPDAPPQPF